MDYLLKSSAIITLFYMCYKLFLKKETFFQSNRWFLITGLLVAVLLPSLVIPIYIEYTPIGTSITPDLITDTAINTSQENQQPINWMSILFWTYIIGVSFFSIKLLFELASLHNLITKYPIKHFGNFMLIEIFEKIAPFSFFKWIVYNPKQFKKQELDLIINHEKVHAKEHHTIDILLAQCCCIIFWFNPLVWFYKKSLQQNLEFIADEKAQNISACKKDYQRLLLKASLPTHQLAITNKFYNSLIKKRIVMLHKSKSNKLNAWKYLLILPFLGLFFMSFNTKEVYIEKTTFKTDNTSETFTVLASTTNSELAKIESYFSNKELQLKFSNISRNTDKTIREITIKTNHDGGTKFTKRMTVKNHDQETIKPFSIALTKNEKDILFQFSEEEATLVSKDRVTFGKDATTKLSSKRIIDKDDGLGKNPLYIVNGKQLKKEDFKNKTYYTNESIEVINKQEGLKRYGKSGKDGVIIFNGKTTFKSLKNTNTKIAIIITKDFTEADLDNVISDLKKEGITAKFKGLKRNASGEIIAIKIDVKSENSNANYNISSDNPINSIKIAIDDNAISIGNISSSEKKLTFISNDKKKHNIISQNNVYVIKEIDTETEAISPKKAKSFTKVIELKKDDDDEYEIIELKSDKNHKEKIIKLKSISGSDEAVEIIESDTLVFNGKNHAIEWQSDTDEDENIFYINTDKSKAKHYFILDTDDNLFIINGKESTKEAFSKLDHDTIESMNVIKGDKATEAYGSKGKNGVIVITTKDKK